MVGVDFIVLVAKYTGIQANIDTNTRTKSRRFRRNREDYFKSGRDFKLSAKLRKLK